MRRAVVDLASERPVWSAPAETTAAIRSAFSGAWTVEAVGAPTASDGDGAGGSPEAVRLARGAEVYIGWGIAAAVADAARATLRWAHSAAAGAGGSITAALRESGAILTNSAGIYAEPMADSVLAAIAYSVRGFHDAARAQREARWAKDAFTDGRRPVRELADTRVGLFGLGGIGRAVARRCAALGMRVAAVRRDPSKPAPPEVMWVGGPGDARRLARESDVLVLCAARTRDTDRAVSAEVLDALPPGAVVINVARGAVLDEAALLARLDDGRLAGAVLDVFREEPLPAAHPLWTHPRVLVLPHVSGVSDRYWERETALIVDNIGRFRAGRPLRNVVDLDLGY